MKSPKNDHHSIWTDVSIRVNFEKSPYSLILLCPGCSSSSLMGPVADRILQPSFSFTRCDWQVEVLWSGWWAEGSECSHRTLLSPAPASERKNKKKCQGQRQNILQKVDDCVSVLQHGFIECHLYFRNFILVSVRFKLLLQTFFWK